MFKFLATFNLISALISFIMLCLGNSPMAWIISLISSLLGSFAFFRIDDMEKTVSWLSEIAKKHGYKHPTEQKPDIYTKNTEEE